ncbi:MAG: hypothetical protein QOJ93_954 [Actinomycetota bacterium]|jgi:hypothetical protein|nr:hypothetical protein [Actinomycetota bacterium]
MTAAEIQAPTTVPCGAGTLTFAEDGDVTVEGMDASATVAIPEIRKGDYVHVWCGRDWACFLTEDGPTVWCAWPAKGRLEKIAELDRLDLRGKYDPGGLHRIEFQPLPDGDLLILHEVGLARVTPEGELLWQTVHDQLSARLEHLDQAAIWLQGEDEPFGFRLDDGILIAGVP